MNVDITLRGVSLAQIDLITQALNGTPEPAVELHAVPDAPVPSEAITPAPVPSEAAPETDSAGVVWDANLHASTKTKKKDGTWKAKRGAAPEPVATPEPEQRSILTYSDVLAKITTNINSGKLDPIAVGTMLAEHGLSGVVDLSTRLDLLGIVDRALDGMLAGSDDA